MKGSEGLCPMIGKKMDNRDRIERIDEKYITRREQLDRNEVERNNSD